MANLSLNQNQTFQSAILGMCTAAPQPNTLTVQINPASTATVISAGQAVKLISGAGPGRMVDVCSAVTDGPVAGVINYNLRKNTYSPGDWVEISARGNVILLKSSAAITAGTNVSTTNQTVSTNDPTVATDTTSTHYLTGVALTAASGAGQLVEVQVAPALLGTAGAISPTLP